MEWDWEAPDRWLPVYLVVDVSASMAGHIENVNEALRGLVERLKDDPLLSEQIQLAIISFSDTARVLLPLTRGYEIEHLPPLRLGGGTDYQPAFKLAKSTIDADIRKLRRDAHKVYRPIMFFVSDGAPLRGWEDGLSELRSVQWRNRPSIITFGFGDADPTILQKIASGPGMALMASQSSTPAQAFAALVNLMLGSMKTTSVSMQGASSAAKVSIPRGIVQVPPKID